MRPTRRFPLPSAPGGMAAALSLLGLTAGALLPAGTQAQGAVAACQEGLAPVTPLEGTLERVQVPGPSLEGNLEGDAPDRCISVYLPPSYHASPERRYPVVYVLHGYTDDDQHWFGWTEHFVNVPVAMENALAAETARS